MGQPEGGPLARHAGAIRGVATAALLVGVWALVPPYKGPELATKASAEFADHVVPGIAVIAIASACLVASRRGIDPTLGFLAGLAVILAGFWMTATHMPLVLQAARDQAPWGAAIFHTLPGLAVLGVGGFWTLRFWGDEETGAPDSSSPGTAEDA